MTQTLHNLATILEALALIALYWGGPLVVAALAFYGIRRGKVRYHVGNPRVNVPVETFKTKQAAREASIRLYREHGRAFQITRTR